MDIIVNTKIKKYMELNGTFLRWTITILPYVIWVILAFYLVMIFSLRKKMKKSAENMHFEAERMKAEAGRYLQLNQELADITREVSVMFEKAKDGKSPFIPVPMPVPSIGFPFIDSEMDDEWLSVEVNPQPIDDNVKCVMREYGVPMLREAFDNDEDKLRSFVKGKVDSSANSRDKEFYLTLLYFLKNDKI
jgi:hypothetical protein